MKILLVPVGSHGDVHPFVGIGRELKARGHAVTMICNGYFRELAEREGLNLVELGTAEQYRQAIEDPDIWHPTRGPKKVFEWAMLGILRPMYQLIEQHHEPGNTVMAAAGLGLGARVAHDKLKIPMATVHLQPVVFRSLSDPPRLPGAPLPQWAPDIYKRLFFWIVDNIFVDPILLPKLNGFRAELGLPPVKRVMQDWWHAPQRVIGLFPEWYAGMPDGWPQQFRCAGFPLYDERGVAAMSPEVEAFLQAGPPPIAFTPGSAHRHAQDFFHESAEACHMLGRRGILLTRFPENIPARLPEDVLHAPYVPFGELLPRTAALVHHGGIGTLAQGLAAGIPQLVMPLSHDQPDNAMRLDRLGVSDSLPPKRYRAAAVAKKLRRLLESPEVAAACKAVARKFEGARSRETACDLIEGLANRPK